MGICTHCGRDTKTTDDHAIASCLWVGQSNDRSIIAKSCDRCNNRAEEGLLKSFFALFDERIARQRLGRELLHPKGAGDLRSFLRTCKEDVSKSYPDERVTRLLKKMMQGLRRHLLRRDWSFVPADAVTVASLTRAGDGYEARCLPLKVGGPNAALPVPDCCLDEKLLDRAFRGFRYGHLGDGVIGLRYGPRYMSNELFLLAAFGTAG